MTEPPVPDEFSPDAESPDPEPQPESTPSQDPAGESGAGSPALEELPGGVRAAVEAILMVADQPVTEDHLAAVLERPKDLVQRVLVDLRREYDGYTGGNSPTIEPAAPRGFELRNIAGGWRIYSRKHFSSVVADFVLDGRSSRLSQAALETLAVIAYRQPVSRARVSAIRGVAVDSVVRTLVQRGLVVEVETDPVSGAALYGTTALFLEKLGVGSVSELPRIAPHLPGIEALGEYDDTTF
ncbi:SMC-Scp complex subunit ScpB [Arthrobacter echini]|uniref:SMC-Scp complex subunit ScpB n=1 Tax=Arthrobacter echini TaxID=1529066 RepID=A0A4S5E0L6_9MICC|nr:SMC-Scp complex subunit ScpB [Arthrobacter echini]THJ64858.1 SMC-Scp complex subunit ScpB [Arthrobacter echini]